MLNIIYISDYEISTETKIVLERICVLVSQYITLPEQIQIEFRKLDENVYGETSLDPRFKNRVVLNTHLSLDELIKPLIHELIHIHQIHTGKLSKRNYNFYIWEGKTYNISKTLSYKQYKNLPWELDVAEKEQVLYKSILGK